MLTISSFLLTANLLIFLESIAAYVSAIEINSKFFSLFPFSFLLVNANTTLKHENISTVTNNIKIKRKHLDEV